MVERKKQGLGKPDIIYVKNFDSFEERGYPGKRKGKRAAAIESPDLQNMKDRNCKNEKSGLANFESLDLQKEKALSSKNCNSGITGNETLDFPNLEPNYNNNNNTDSNYTNHINQSYQSGDRNDAIDRMDGIERASDCIVQIKENIEYDIFMNDSSYHDRELYHELYEII